MSNQVAAPRAGKHLFLDILHSEGVEIIFGNPGTTESPLLDALLDYPTIEYVVALHEGMAVGAASYYARASGRTGVVSLHVAPGLGNGIGGKVSMMRPHRVMGSCRQDKITGHLGGPLMDQLVKGVLAVGPRFTP